MQTFIKFVPHKKNRTFAASNPKYEEVSRTSQQRQPDFSADVGRLLCVGSDRATQARRGHGALRDGGLCLLQLHHLFDAQHDTATHPHHRAAAGGLLLRYPRGSVAAVVSL